MSRPDVITASRARVDCLVCPVQNCLGRCPSDDGAAAWSALLATPVPVMPGAAPLVSAGNPLQSLYSVRAGCIKTYTVDAEGQERVRGFYLPGDLIGLDAIGSGILQSSAAAVEPSQVCVAPIEELRQVLHTHPRLARHLVDQTSRELAMALALSGDFSAEQRMAAFLLQMEQRLHARDGLLRLSIPQRDIGNYLRLANETVCRTLKRFAQRGWLRSETRGLRLTDRCALQDVAEPVGLGLSAPSWALAA